MKALLCSIGSRGDIQPMLVLGRELRQRGHQVCFAAPPNFKSSAEAQDMPFRPVGADTERIIEENERLARRSPVLALPGQIALLRRETDQQVRDLLRGAEPVDLVVGAGLAFGARIYAESYARAYAYVCYTLSGIRCDAYPPAALPIFGMPRWGNALTWSLVTRLFDLALGDVLAGIQREQQLAQEARPWRSIHAAVTVLAQDEVIGRVSPGARGVHAQVPALVPPSSETPPWPEFVEAFIEAQEQQGALVYLGFGSMPVSDRERLVRAACELHDRTGARVLLYARGLRPGELLSRGVLGIGAVDHARLFPKTSLVVHHGGAGTLATALRAGAPQWVVPHIVDQFFHGRRVWDLGLGPEPVPVNQFDAARLREAFELRERFAARARQVAAELAGQGGAAPAADFLERLVQTRTQGGSAPNPASRLLSASGSG